MKKIMWLTTGGTIASELSQNGLSPNMKAERLFGLLGNIKDRTELIMEEVFSLDSSNIQPEEWQILARRVAERQDFYDGIIITHGTDTMAYTASALSFMLKNVKVPVVLTGSQLPMGDALSDANENLRTALAMAESGHRGVFIAFDRHIILGTRAVKVRTTDFNAYESVNLPCVGEINSRGLVIRKELLPQLSEAFELKEELCREVVLIKLIPGLEPSFFEAFTALKIRGLVIEAFGIGGITNLRRDITNALQKLVEHGIAVVVCSQCLYESSDFSVYEVGQKALKAGVIQAHDMTSEAAVTKLMWALGQTTSLAEVRRIFDTNLVNEVKPE